VTFYPQMTQMGLAHAEAQNYGVQRRLATMRPLREYQKMSGLVISFLSAGITLIVGSLSFVLSQIVTRFVFEPAGDLRKLIVEIDTKLTYHRAVLGSPPDIGDDRFREAKDEMRRLASALRSADRMIMCHEWVAALGWVPHKAEIREASSNLIGLSNTEKDQFDVTRMRLQKIAGALGFEL
jgi:hypothetical protein